MIPVAVAVDSASKTRFLGVPQFWQNSSSMDTSCPQLSQKGKNAAPEYVTP
jgi:hypothetical protein